MNGSNPCHHVAPICTVFVKGLSKTSNEGMLMSVFAQFGAVVQCQIARHRSGRSAGFAIVTYSTHEEAAHAKKMVDKSTFLNRRLTVQWYEADLDSMKALLTPTVRLTPCDPRTRIVASTMNNTRDLPHDPYNVSHLGEKANMRDQHQALVPALTGTRAWMTGQQQQAGGVQDPMEQSLQDANWSAMVGTWLNDYESLHGGMGPATGTTDRRSTTASNFSFNNDMVDMTGFRLTADSVQEDHKVSEDVLVKNRLARMWTRGTSSFGGATIDERTSDGGFSQLSVTSQKGSEDWASQLVRSEAGLGESVPSTDITAAMFKAMGSLGLTQPLPGGARGSAQQHQALPSVNNVQQQYADALHQFNSARAHIMAVAASLQAPPKAMQQHFPNNVDPYMQIAFQQSMMHGSMGGVAPPAARRPAQ